ncbi:Rieske 2Fe-2S domain-containing protein [Microbacterium esteraromaticum]|uniref:Cytochrome bc1 complex Rieske iron-sulfur subunit n=1 Tax=Microbacterium esteraromaticum TaxID=57043 RepID=A0A939IVG6_9MICO|nr:Rieske 2Fe-2S domain-containing protein [Microbacterium esteraromaticum]MBN7792184.1 Rieske 2Fe-2S domain-containing protein [Microbacterium esteraromaticum]MBN8206436.1 Rieske 2Fe-2S domain-containing protein [Microbacterium esteraromaticum]MBN8416591.1 Rieske 2Fe-2S domain-containing protein [Microbacterium esteraromaticum]MBN8423011.1 Rieske 2Fe-2S domain-containing protein [Microbacterium esteraromaticum]MBY6062292.1 Rieske 2Fe-2S domain-containing protein [Microbacterium esteraromaticu
MANDDDTQALDRAYQPSPGLGVAVSDPAENPGLPPHRERMTDKDPRIEKTAERTVYTLFYLSLAGSIWAVAAYMLFPIESGMPIDIRQNNMYIGIGIALALLAIGIGAIHWSKALMSDKEYIEHRHPTRGRDTTREAAVQVFAEADQDSGFGRRKMIRNSLIVAVVASVVPGITLFRGLAPHNTPEKPHAGDPVYLLSHTMWESGMRLARDPEGTPIRAADVTVGSAFHVIPEPLKQLDHSSGYLEEKAKAIVLLMRLRPEQLIETEERKDWSYDGIVAYSKVCTHVGCPVALYEQQTHHLLCPCHQSQFDVTDQAKVIFGPAARPLPQLPIAVDDEGYLIAQRDFTEPVGPSFWERH